MDPKYMCDRKVKCFSACGPDDLEAVINEFAKNHYIHQVSYVVVHSDKVNRLVYKAMVLYEEYEIDLHLG